jgi:hypothetical protein
LVVIPESHRSQATVVVPLLVRTGIVGGSRSEKTWALAWRYSNHNTDAFDRDIIVVTEHGWASLWSHAAGVLPATAPAA